MKQNALRREMFTNQERQPASYPQVFRRVEIGLTDIYRSATKIMTQPVITAQWICVLGGEGCLIILIAVPKKATGQSPYYALRYLTTTGIGEGEYSFGTGKHSGWRETSGGIYGDFYASCQKNRKLAADSFR
ncbi:hypothetical protein IW262DRAFT_1485649 [Armillaria fumosa]|nr:hypothetical protein IW262DRAFT_1485649 [Armillaria fumosa]